MAIQKSPIRIHLCARFSIQKDWIWMRQSNLWICLDGHGTFSTRAETHRMETGACFLMRDHEEYSGAVDPETKPFNTGILYSYVDETGAPVQPPVERPVYRRLENMSFIVELLTRIERGYNEKDSVVRAEAEIWLQALFAEIDRQDMQPKTVRNDRMQAAAIERICAAIRANPGFQYRINDLADAIHCTRHHFSRIFKKQRGVSPQEYILQARIQTAKSLLHRSSHSVGNIADMLGYRDIFYFSKQFKTKCGITPTKYREKKTGGKSPEKR